MDDGRVDSTLDSLAADHQLTMLTNGWQWRYDDELRTPEVEEVAEGLSKMIERLTDEPVGTGIQAGRLYITKSQEGLYDVYTYTGTVTD